MGLGTTTWPPVRLHVDRADLQTLYCHACVPKENVVALPNGDLSCGKEMYTAVAQLASSCLMSLLSDALRGVSLEKVSQIAGTTLQTRREPYEDASSFLDKENTESPSGPSSQGTGSRYTPSVSLINRKISLRFRSSCRITDIPSQGED